MTPEQLDKLRRIDAHLANLLSTAEKRTGGEWIVTKYGDNPESYPGIEATDSGDNIVDNHYDYEGGGVNGMNNAAFIASCAGNAESGWRATRAAIATALDCESRDAMINEMYIRQDAEAILESILAAFPNV